MAAKGITVSICWGKNIVQSDWQKKVFKDVPAALEFCQKHYKTIQLVNKLRTNGEKRSQFDLLHAIEHPDEYVR